jgi:hypothetical protein
VPRLSMLRRRSFAGAPDEGVIALVHALPLGSLLSCWVMAVS